MKRLNRNEEIKPMTYKMSVLDMRIQWKAREQTEYSYLRNELKNKNVYFPPEYRKYLEARVEELRKQFEPDSVSD